MNQQSITLKKDIKISYKQRYINEKKKEKMLKLI